MQNRIPVMPTEEYPSCARPKAHGYRIQHLWFRKEQSSARHHLPDAGTEQFSTGKSNRTTPGNTKRMNERNYTPEFEIDLGNGNKAILKSTAGESADNQLILFVNEHAGEHNKAPIARIQKRQTNSLPCIRTEIATTIIPNPNFTSAEFKELRRHNQQHEGVASGINAVENLARAVAKILPATPETMEQVLLRRGWKSLDAASG